MSSAIAANSAVLPTCTPLLLVKVTPSGSQSSGSSGSMPAPVIWISSRCGARLGEVAQRKTRVGHHVVRADEGTRGGERGEVREIGSERTLDPCRNLVAFACGGDQLARDLEHGGFIVAGFEMNMGSKIATARQIYL